MKKILITGAGGFIGSHLTEALVEKGYDVRAFVHYNSFNSWGWLDYIDSDIKKSLDVFSADIRDPHVVKKAMCDREIIFHLAALIGIPYSYSSPGDYIDTNIRGTLNVLQAARELGLEKVVHTSTSEVYGTALFVPINEDHPLQAQSPYAASKIGADQIAMSFYASFGIPVAIIRPFNTYGPRQSARAVIPTIITQIVRGLDKINLGSLSPTRDFSYVKDTVAGFIAVAESDQSIGQVFNVGSGYEISIKDTAMLISQIMDVEIECVTDDVRIRPEKSEVERLWADNSKAKRLLGWEPVYDQREGFKRGLIETVNWYSDLENLKPYKESSYNI